MVQHLLDRAIIERRVTVGFCISQVVRMILSVYSLCSFLLLPPFFANISFHFHWTIYPVNQGLAWTELAFYTGTLHKFVRFGAMDVTKPNPGAIEVTNPDGLMRFGAMDITEP